MSKPDPKQRTLNEEAKRSQRGRRLKDRRDARYPTIYHRMMVWAIVDRIGMHRESWVMTFSELAHDCQMSRRHVYRTASELKKTGLIDFKEVEPNSGKYDFRVCWSNLSELAEIPVQEQEKIRGRRRKVVPEGHNTTPEVVSVSHNSNEKVVPGGQNLCPPGKTCAPQANAPLISAPKRTNSAQNPKPPEWVGEIPDSLQTEEFQTAWIEWCLYRKKSKHPSVSELAAKRQLNKLEKVGVEAAIDCIHESIANDWQGLFPKPKELKHGKPTIEERQLSELDKAKARAKREEQGSGSPDAPVRFLPGRSQ